MRSLFDVPALWLRDSVAETVSAYAAPLATYCPLRTLLRVDAPRLPVHIETTALSVLAWMREHVHRYGRKLEFDAVDVIDLEDGLIKQLTSWYDIAWVRDQLATAS